VITYNFLCQCSSAQEGSSYSLAALGLLPYQPDQFWRIKRGNLEFLLGENIFHDTGDILRKSVRYVEQGRLDV
jgi:hypothetical protein